MVSLGTRGVSEDCEETVPPLKAKCGAACSELPLSHQQLGAQEAPARDQEGPQERL